jgi:hypothetical protein
MKKTVIILMTLIITVALPAYAQKRNQLGITFSGLGKCDVWTSQNLIGGAAITGDKYYSFGLIYLYRLNKIFDIETGFEYSKYKIIITPNLPPQYDNSPHSESATLLNIPISVRLNFLKYCFINTGIGFNMDTGNSGSLDSQTGIGANLGLGLKYGFKQGLSVFVNPYLKVNSLISFSLNDSHQRLSESGIKLGLVYNFQ